MTNFHISEPFVYFFLPLIILQNKSKNVTIYYVFWSRFVEDHAVNLTVDIQKYISDPDLAPLFQSALSDCLDQYNPLDDLIEDAINAVLAKDYGGAKKFVEAAVTNINSCDAEFKANDVQEEVEKKAGEDVQLAKNLKEYNLFLKKMLSASLNILNAN